MSIFFDYFNLKFLYFYFIFYLWILFSKYKFNIIWIFIFLNINLIITILTRNNAIYTRKNPKNTRNYANYMRKNTKNTRNYAIYARKNTKNTRKYFTCIYAYNFSLRYYAQMNSHFRSRYNAWFRKHAILRVFLRKYA